MGATEEEEEEEGDVELGEFFAIDEIWIASFISYR